MFGFNTFPKGFVPSVYTGETEPLWNLSKVSHLQLPSGAEPLHTVPKGWPCQFLVGDQVYLGTRVLWFFWGVYIVISEILRVSFMTCLPFLPPGFLDSLQEFCTWKKPVAASLMVAFLFGRSILCLCPGRNHEFFPRKVFFGWWPQLQHVFHTSYWVQGNNQRETSHMRQWLQTCLWGQPPQTSLWWDKQLCTHISYMLASVKLPVFDSLINIS